MSTLRARYIGYTEGTENHGDEALMWILRDLLAPEIDVQFGGGTADIALLGGGTLVNQSPWLIDQFGDALAQAPLGGLVFGTGVGHPAFWGDHFEAWGALLARCPLVGVRGPRSLDLLRRHGVDHAEDIGDPYLALRPPMLSPPSPGLLGVNFGLTNDSLWGGDEAATIEFLEAALRRLQGQGWRFLFLSVWSKDLPAVQALRDRLGDADAPVLDARAQPLEALSRLSGCQLVIGEKLHACAMAAVAEVPFIALEYQPKVADFAESVLMGDFVMPTSERDPRMLAHLAGTLARQREVVRVRLQHALADRRGRIQDFARRAKARFADSARRAGATP